MVENGSVSRRRLILSCFLLSALSLDYNAPVNAFAFQPSKSTSRRTTLTTTASAVAPDIQTGTSSSSSTASSSRSDFWGQDRSMEEIKIHLSSSHLNIVQDDVEVLSASPPVVVIHNLLTNDQCHAIMDGALQQQLQRSTTYIICDDDDDDVDKDSTSATDEAAPPLTSDIRTSSTVWLRDEEDDIVNDDDGNDPSIIRTQLHASSEVSLLSKTLRQVADYVSHMSGLPPNYMENLQVVRYLPGQEFQVHTDHLDSFNELERGGRLATCLFYLQPPTRGGATYFPEVDVEVVPRRGSALFFWNTLERPGCPEYEERMFLHADERVRHAGLPVMEGEKWICNRWVHPVDYGAGVRGL